MTSRERVLMAINHKQPGRIPIDFGGYNANGIIVQVYKKLHEW